MTQTQWTNSARKFTATPWLMLGLLTVVLLGRHQPAAAINVTPNNNATDLVNAIVGPGITVVGVPTFTGDASAAGTFSSGGAAVGFDSGIILSSGQVADAVGPNDNDGFGETLGGFDGVVGASTNFDLPGDADLEGVVGTSTNDAASLEFSFQFGDGSGGGNLFFRYIFGSDEYIDFVGSQFNDGFALFIDGVNVAQLPGGNGPVTINNVNPLSNSGFYRNNIDPSLLDIEYDGLTTVLTAQALGLGPGVHTMKFVTGDTTDFIFDSAVFVQAGTFSTTDPNPGEPGAVPEPSSMVLAALGLAGLGCVAWRRYRRRAGRSV